MPKNKTHSGASKRFRVTGSGKILREKAGKRHNLEKKAYPAMFVGTGLWDSQVQYWEPAKYVAKLRTLDASPSPVLLRVNMEAGHGGKSGRFQRYRELSESYAFVLQQLGIVQP